MFIALEPSSDIFGLLCSGDLNASEITMSDEHRIQLMILVKEGKLSMHEAVEAVSAGS